MSEPRYIDADALLAEIKHCFDMQDLYLPCHLIEMIEEQPTADVAPVVRCKDCRLAYDDYGGRVCAYGVCAGRIVDSDFYCAYGEWMDGEGDA